MNCVNKIKQLFLSAFLPLTMLGMFLWVRTSSAETIGVSYYALAAFSEAQCASALKVFEGVKTPALAVLWDTFGTSDDCLKTYLKLVEDRDHILEIHLSNQTCLRHGDCAPYELSGALNESPHAYAKQIEAGDPEVIGEYQNRILEIVNWVAGNRTAKTRILISTGLEDNYSDIAYKVILRMLLEARNVTPFDIVRNPAHHKINAAEKGKANYLESHGMDVSFPRALWQQCIVNNDGVNISFNNRSGAALKPLSQFRKMLARSGRSPCLDFLWWSSVQGLESTAQEKNALPRARTFRVIPREIAAIHKVILSNQ